MRKEYQIIVDYVEGRIEAEEFHQVLLNDKILQKTLKNSHDVKCQYLKPYNYNLFDYFMQGKLFQSTNWNKIRLQYVLQAELIQFLHKNSIECFKYEKYENDYDFLLDIQPAWLNIDDDSIFQQILSDIPQDLSKSKRVKLGKEKVKTLFKYDKTYPRWIQNPEWPIVNGKPLVFSHQINIKGDDFHTLYYFYDEDTKEQTVIEQFG